MKELFAPFQKTALTKRNPVNHELPDLCLEVAGGVFALNSEENWYIL
jgi:hypothetical protein